jgi:hypothetical protein
MILTALQKLALNLALRLLAFVGEYATGLIRSFVAHVRAERADDPTLAAEIKGAVERANARRVVDPSVPWLDLLKRASNEVMDWAATAGREYSRALVNTLIEGEVLAQREPLPPDSARLPPKDA